jgi:hypothetical protein
MTKKIKLKTGKYRLARTPKVNLIENTLFIKRPKPFVITFNNWVKLTEEDIELEYKVEYMFHIRYHFGEIFPSIDDFKKAINKARIMTITKEIDYRIGNRSYCNDIECIFSLIRTYRSYPEFRNEDTVLAIDKAFKDNSSMKMPLILELETDRGTKYWCMSGNTRLDLAFINGVEPQALIINITEQLKNSRRLNLIEYKILSINKKVLINELELDLSEIKVKKVIMDLPFVNDEHYQIYITGRDIGGCGAITTVLYEKGYGKLIAGEYEKDSHFWILTDNGDYYIDLFPIEYPPNPNKYIPMWNYKLKYGETPDSVWTEEDLNYWRKIIIPYEELSEDLKKEIFGDTFNNNNDDESLEMAYRMTDIHWLNSFLINNIIFPDKEKGNFISFSYDDYSDIDQFGDIEIVFNIELLGDIIDVDYPNIEDDPELCKYVTGYYSEEDYKEGNAYDEEFSWDLFIQTFENEREFVIKDKLEYKEGIILKIIFSKRYIKNPKVLQTIKLLKEKKIPYTYRNI